MDEILSLMAEWDAEKYMDTSSMFHMRESYVLKSQSQNPDALQPGYAINVSYERILCYQDPRHDPDTPTYMEALSGDKSEEYFKAMDYEIQILMRRDTWEIVSRESVADKNVLPGTWYFK